MIEFIFVCWLVLLANGDVLCQCTAIPVPSSKPEPPVTTKEFRREPVPVPSTARQGRSLKRY